MTVMTCAIEKLQLRSALRSAGVDIDVTDVLTGGQLQDTNTGAPTLELDLLDREYAALNSGVFGQKVDVELDRVPFRLTTVSVTGPETLHLLFEHKIVALLREHSSPIKAARDTTTRAQFVERMLKEIVHNFPASSMCARRKTGCNRSRPRTCRDAPSIGEAAFDDSEAECHDRGQCGVVVDDDPSVGWWCDPTGTGGAA